MPHPERQVAAAPDGDRQPEVHEPPREHADRRDRCGHAEPDERRDQHALDDAKAAAARLVKAMDESYW